MSKNDRFKVYQAPAIEKETSDLNGHHVTTKAVASDYNDDKNIKLDKLKSDISKLFANISLSPKKLDPIKPSIEERSVDSKENQVDIILEYSPNIDVHSQSTASDEKLDEIIDLNQHVDVFLTNGEHNKDNGMSTSQEECVNKEEEQKEVDLLIDINVDDIEKVKSNENIVANNESKMNSNNDELVDTLLININELKPSSFVIDELLDNLNLNQNSDVKEFNSEKLIEFDTDQNKTLTSLNATENLNEKLIDIEEDVRSEQPIVDKLIEIDDDQTNASLPDSIKREENAPQCNNLELDEIKSKLNEFNDDQKTLGILAPVWIPDADVNDCMKCNSKFTFRKRRHHCRGCGLLFCATCCNLRLNLPYKPKVQSRVCNLCYEVIEKSIIKKLDLT